MLRQEHLQPTYMADAEITMSDVNDGTLDSINRLAPFGSGNPSPIFMAKGVKVLNASPVGDSAWRNETPLSSRSRSWWKMTVRNPSARTI